MSENTPSTSETTPAPRTGTSSSSPAARTPASRPPGGRGSGRFAPRTGGYDSRVGGRPRRGGPPRRKVCRFCAEKVFEVDYKAIHVVRSFMTPRGKILSGRITGNCARHQRQVTIAVKRAQNIALLPTVGE